MITFCILINSNINHIFKKSKRNRHSNELNILLQLRRMILYEMTHGIVLYGMEYSMTWLNNHITWNIAGMMTKSK